MISQLKSMDDENKRLKKMFAELNMQNDLLKEALEKSVEAVSEERDGHQRCSTTWRQSGFCLPNLFYQPALLLLR
tara:strand:- start:2638 stop:2862 length:225 start_codon:yes stop_codon:yes gene_type:complete